MTCEKLGSGEIIRMKISAAAAADDDDDDDYDSTDNMTCKLEIYEL